MGISGVVDTNVLVARLIGQKGPQGSLVSLALRGFATVYWQRNLSRYQNFVYKVGGRLRNS